MSGSHGDLFQEIGKLVVAAHAGQAIDLDAKSEELAERYGNLGMPADLIARAIARSLGAISVSMAIVANGHRGSNGHHANGYRGHAANGHGRDHLNGNGHASGNGEALPGEGTDAEELVAQPTEAQVEAASALFPSGLRIAVLS
jgi:hypothetical protein